MIVTLGYRLPPGKCFCCGTTTPSQRTVDLQRDDPDAFHQYRVVICAHCVMAMANLLEKDGEDVAIMSGVVARELRTKANERDMALARLGELEQRLADVADSIAAVR